jgi:hypothetical protein
MREIRVLHRKEEIRYIVVSDPGKASFSRKIGTRLAGYLYGLNTNYGIDTCMCGAVD